MIKYHFVRGDKNRWFESLRIKKDPSKIGLLIGWGTLPNKMIKYHFVRGDENRGFESLRIKKRPIRDRSFLNWGGRIRTSEMAGPKPAALPLGDAPSRLYSIYHILSMLNVKSY